MTEPRLPYDCARCMGVRDTPAGPVLCPMKDDCLRHLAPGDPVRQAYLVLPQTTNIHECEHYWPHKEEADE